MVFAFGVARLHVRGKVSLNETPFNAKRCWGW
jgi:hypothetical protein